VYDETAQQVLDKGPRSDLSCSHDGHATGPHIRRCRDRSDGPRWRRGIDPVPTLAGTRSASCAHAHGGFGREMTPDHPHPVSSLLVKPPSSMHWTNLTNHAASDTASVIQRTSFNERRIGGNALLNNKIDPGFASNWPVAPPLLGHELMLTSLRSSDFAKYESRGTAVRLRRVSTWTAEKGLASRHFSRYSRRRVQISSSGRLPQ
jgi:hypothetical protein